MNIERHRPELKVSRKKRERSVSSHKNDAYLAVWALSKLGWSNRRIAKLKLPTSHHTINEYLSKACELIEDNKLPILAKSERALRQFSAGKSDDVAYLYSKVHQNPCGGGRKTKQHTYNSDCVYNGKESYESNS